VRWELLRANPCKVHVGGNERAERHDHFAPVFYVERHAQRVAGNQLREEGLAVPISPCAILLRGARRHEREKDGHSHNLG
jgi:hypothetical protein